MVASMKISAAQTKGIQAFFASESGKRYLQVQLAAFSKSAGWYQEFRSEAIRLGLVDQTSDEQEPLLLPKGK